MPARKDKVTYLPRTLSLNKGSQDVVPEDGDSHSVCTDGCVLFRVQEQLLGRTNPAHIAATRAQRNLHIKFLFDFSLSLPAWKLQVAHLNNSQTGAAYFSWKIYF